MRDIKSQILECLDNDDYNISFVLKSMPIIRFLPEVKLLIEAKVIFVQL